MKKILLAEDEKELAKATATILKYSGYDVTCVYNGKEAVENSKNNFFDIIILDIMMPVMDGISALKELRKIGINTPVILLTAKAQIDDKDQGLDAGANDYLTKPFNAKELLARIRAISRAQEEVIKKFEIGNITFNKEQAELSNDITALRLNNRECEIMEVLIKNQETAVPKKELINRFWKESKNSDSAVQMYISFLQEKLEALNANIKINEKNGYILEKV